LVPSSEDVVVAVHDLGGSTDPRAPVVLFAHATGFHGRVWGPLAAHLADRYRTLAVDLRGHGVTQTPPDASLAWSAIADDVAAVLSHERLAQAPAIHGVGHSLGGAALVLAAARRPGAVRSLWLYEPIVAGPGELLPADGSNPLADGALRRRSSFASYDAAIANFATKPPLNQLDPEVLSAYVRGGFAPQPDGSVVLRCAPATESTVFRGAMTSGAFEVLDELAMPVAVVAGRDEPVGPVRLVPAMVEALRDGRRFDRPDLGHFGPLEDPPSMARDLTDWLADVGE
jgi:pimeloyl-ACP methyl ester carboxylesterase